MTMTMSASGAQVVEIHAGDHRRDVLQRRFNDRPLLVFWEMTKACDLACFHCRADAQREPSSCELTTDEGHRMIDELAQLSSPRPILILTGGDCLKRPDLLEIIDYAKSASVPVALAPSVTPLLTPERMRELRQHGIKTVSISLDGMNAGTHDAVRGVAGHFDATMITLRELKDAGFTVQINTTVMARNVEQMADIAAILHAHHIDIWEVFFLISTGRGIDVNASTPQQNEDLCHFLVDASRYGFTVRSVEGPFLRRVNQQRHEGVEGPPTSDLYARLHSRLEDVLGQPTHEVCAPSAATRDGNGIVFVGATGDVYPSGFLPLPLGNLRSASLIDIYRDTPLMRAIRDAAFLGVCGSCSYRQLCGGSRSRAFATSGDPLESDPACLLVDRANERHQKNS
jgi:radical SAM protein